MRGKEVKIMPYQKCKIYNDGSHFIAIPHTTRPAVPKRYHPEEVIEVIDDMPQQQQLNTDKCNAETALTALNDTSEVDSREHSEQNESPPTGEISTPITVTPKQLEKIEITREPNKTTYIQGQNFDSTGMQVTATYNSGKTAIINKYSIPNGQNLTAGMTSVKIVYTENGEYGCNEN